MLATRNAVIAALAASTLSAYLTHTLGAPASPPAGPPASPPAARMKFEARQFSATPALNAESHNTSIPHPARNLFTYDDPPRIVRTATLTPPLPQQPAAPQPVALPQQPEPPRPPEIAFRCIGRFGPADAPLAALARDRDIINVHAGDIVDGKFIVRSIGIESIAVGFVGFARDADRRIEIGP